MAWLWAILSGGSEVIGNCDFGTDAEGEAELFGSGMSPRRAINAVNICDRESVIPEMLSPLRQVLRRARPRQKRKI